MSKLKGLAVLFAIALGVNSAPARAEDSGITVFGFQAGLLGVFQGGGDSFSFHAAWTPRVGIPGGISLRGEFGWALLKNALNEKFSALNYEAFIGLPLAPLITIEGGGGWQTWVNNGGTNSTLGLNLALGLPSPLISRVQFGYSRIFMGGSGANQIKVAVGIDF